MGNNKAKIAFAGISLLLHLLLLSAIDLFPRPEGDEKLGESYIITFPLVEAYPEEVGGNLDSAPGSPRRVSHFQPASGAVNNLILNTLRLISNGRMNAEKKIVCPQFNARHNPPLNQAVVVYVPFSSQAPVSFAFLDCAKSTAGSVPAPRPLRLQNRHIDNELLRYQQIIKQKINRHKIYPRLARKKGIEGKALIEFLISRDGQVKETRLVKSSNYKILDQAAIRAVSNAGPFLPLPVAINKNELWLKLTVSFKLEK
jgi:TonB family protein